MPVVDAAEFHATVYDICRLIPPGKVTTYGHIARLTGHPSHSRMVGQALKFVGDPSVPWQRVLGSSGAISPRGDGGEGAMRQALALRAEGVEVTQTAMGWRVSLSQFGWFPDQVDLDDEDEADIGEERTV